MAVTTLQVAQTGSTIQVTATQTFARWVIFQNNAAAAMRVGDSNASSSRGFALAASGAANSSLILQPMPSDLHYDLSQWWTEGTSSQNLDIIYDSRT